MAKKPEGFILVHRKLQDNWRWKDPRYVYAWMWLLFKAQWSDKGPLEMGQLYFTVTDGIKSWGMKKYQVVRYLQRCEKDGDIEWKRCGDIKALEQKDHNATSLATTLATTVLPSNFSKGIITILNYRKYQGKQIWPCYHGATTTATTTATSSENSTLLNNKKNNSVSFETTPSLSKKEREKQTAKKTAEYEMDRIDLDKFRSKYPHLNIDNEFTNFINHHLAREASYYGKKKITDWNRAFHTWCNADWKKPKATGPSGPQFDEVC